MILLKGRYRSCFEKDAEVYYINERSRSASEELASLFSYCIQKDGRMFRELVFLCIGSDRITGDSLGPLIGYQLSPYCSRIFMSMERWMTRCTP